MSNLLNLDWINSNLAKYKISNYKVKVIEELESTNTYVLEHLEQFKDKSVLSCEKQTKGRGRFERQWESESGRDLAISMVYYFENSFNFSLLPLVVAVAINQLLQELGIDSKIKWPNDIMLSDKTKICGILIESKMREEKRVIVIGVGLNNILNLDRSELLVLVIKKVDQILNKYLIDQFKYLKQEWLANCIHLNLPIKLYKDNMVVKNGIHRGIADNGDLIIEDDLGKIFYWNDSSLSLSF